MEYPRRKGQASSSKNNLIRAVAVGMVGGLLISAFIFYHRLGMQAQEAELLKDILFHKETAQQERHKRELAEQMQSEADTERGQVQSQLRDMSGSVLAANNARAQSAEEAKQAIQAKQAAEASVTSLEAKLKALQAELQDAKGCEQEGGGASTDPRHKPWRPSAERDSKDPELAAFLRKVAKNDEVLIAISNQNYARPGGMLDSWMRTAESVGLKNAMVVALDEATKAHAESQGMMSIIMDATVSEAQKNVGSNHAVSGLKFRILHRFLQLGYSVLLSDVDIIFLQNPFEHLYRDSDIESMTDGWDNQTAYGYDDVMDDPSMGWARYAHSMRVFCFNSGLFYIRPTEAAQHLLEVIMKRIETEAGWDQAIFNEVMFFPSHNEYVAPAVTRRVMDYYRFMNSKVLFKSVRQNPVLRSQKPVTFHANYHNNKAERLEAAELFYVHGDDSKLMQLEEGS